MEEYGHHCGFKRESPHAQFRHTCLGWDAGDPADPMSGNLPGPHDLQFPPPTSTFLVPTRIDPRAVEEDGAGGGAALQRSEPVEPQCLSSGIHLGIKLLLLHPLLQHSIVERTPLSKLRLHYGMAYFQLNHLTTGFQ